MGFYDSGSYGGGNAFEDQRQTARDRLLGLLDKQRIADAGLTAARDKIANQDKMNAADDWMGRGLKGAAMGAPFGGIGAAIGGGIGTLSGIIGGTAAHHKAGQSWLSSFGDTLAENPVRGLDSALGSPLVGSGIANLAGKYAGDTSRNSSVDSYLKGPSTAPGGAPMAGPSYGAGPKFGADQPFRFKDDEGIEG